MCVLILNFFKNSVYTCRKEKSRPIQTPMYKSEWVFIVVYRFELRQEFTLWNGHGDKTTGNTDRDRR